MLESLVNQNCVQAVLLVLLLSACSQTGLDGDGSVDADVEDLLASAPSGIGTEILNELGIPRSLAGQIASNQRYELRVELSVAGCMAELGFDYFQTRPSVRAAITSDGFDLSGEDYAKNFGFGLATNIDFVSSEEREERRDLNLQYVQSLEGREQERYFAALWGRPDQEIDTGCDGMARAEVPKPEWFGATSRFDDLYGQVEQRILADPRTLQLDNEWSRCVAAEGIGAFASRLDLISALSEELSELMFALGELPDQDLETLRLAISSDFLAKEIDAAIVSQKCTDPQEIARADISREHEVAVLDLA